jgi:ribosomal protein S18 acetylase RimI-like enzyme
MTPDVRPATRESFATLAAALGRAFTDDPAWSWIYPQRDRSRRLTSMFTTLLAVTESQGATVLTDTSVRGAAIWQRSDRRGFGTSGTIRMGVAMVRSGARMRRGEALRREMERRHPQEPHWYLALLGTDPAAQGKGIGSQLLHRVLDDPANASIPAYLETQTAGNVSFYERHSFRVIDQFDMAGGGPHMWLMWRDAHLPS